MAQVHSYPLPPLFLAEILERGKADHTHVCDEGCADQGDGEDDKHCGAAWCRRRKAEDEQLLDVPTIVKIEAGHGRHVHDDPEDVNGCGWRDRDVYHPDSLPRYTVVRERRPATGYGCCIRDCNDSDWVVTVCYSSNEWWATYGVKRAGDVQDVDLWMN